MSNAQAWFIRDEIQRKYVALGPHGEVYGEIMFAELDNAKDMASFKMRLAAWQQAMHNKAAE